MSNPIETNGTPLDLAAECKKWETRCAELLAERESLRAELTTVRRERDQYLKTVYHFMCKDYVPAFTKEEVFSHVNDRPTLDELIAELEREYAPEK